MFVVERYHNWKNGRRRWAAFDKGTGQYYFTKKQGLIESRKLVNELNQLGPEALRQKLATLEHGEKVYEGIEELNESVSKMPIPVACRSCSTFQDRMRRPK